MKRNSKAAVTLCRSIRATISAKLYKIVQCCLLINQRICGESKRRKNEKETGKLSERDSHADTHYSLHIIFANFDSDFVLYILRAQCAQRVSNVERRTSRTGPVYSDALRWLFSC